MCTLGEGVVRNCYINFVELESAVKILAISSPSNFE